MLIYVIPILALFFLSKYRISKQGTWRIIFLLMFFLCFGYMTGSDWRVYETDYNYGFTHRLVEPGYMFLSDLFSSSGINFWFFHILFKCISYICIVVLIYKLHNNKNIFFAFALWYASFGLFLCINCPFRNLIACGIGALAFIALINNNRILFYLLSILAMTFHLSAIILLVIPFCRFDKINSKILISLYLILLIVLIMGGSNIIINLLFSYLPSFLVNRLEFYTDINGSVISFGLVPRMICLYLLIKYRNNITANHRYGNAVFAYAYTSLVVSLIYYAFPMLFRSALFLSPFYVTALAMGLQEMLKKYRHLLRLGIACIFLIIVITTVRSVYYVPYTNIVINAVMGKLYDYDYRDSYNFISSPYGRTRID